MNGDVFFTWQNGHITDMGVEGTAKGTLSGTVKSGNKNIDKYLPGGKITMGGSASWTVQTGFKGTVDPIGSSVSNIPTGL